jgi:hypothetical protein
MANLDYRLLIDGDEKIQEQAFWIVRNLAENEFGIELVFRELGANVLLGSLTSGLESPHEEVVLQACYISKFDRITYLCLSRPHMLWLTSLMDTTAIKTS